MSFERAAYDERRELAAVGWAPPGRRPPPSSVVVHRHCASCLRSRGSRCRSRRQRAAAPRRRCAPPQAAAPAAAASAEACHRRARVSGVQLWSRLARAASAAPCAATCLPRIARLSERRSASARRGIGASLDVRASLDQQLHGCRMRLVGGPHQRRRPAQAFLGVDVRAGVDQRLDRVRIAVARRQHEVGLPGRQRLVRIGPGL